MQTMVTSTDTILTVVGQLTASALVVFFAIGTGIRTGSGRGVTTLGMAMDHGGVIIKRHCGAWVEVRSIGGGFGNCTQVVQVILVIMLPLLGAVQLLSVNENASMQDVNVFVWKQKMV
mgnify:CR=1 FL=1